MTNTCWDSGWNVDQENSKMHIKSLDKLTILNYINVNLLAFLTPMI